MSAHDEDFVFSTLIANHPDPATASRALQLAEANVLRRAADAINALPQDYECDPGRGDAAERLRRTADGIEEKASAPAPTATPQGPVFDPLPSYLHAIGQAGSRYERELYAAYVQAIAEVARLQAQTDDGQPPAGEATPNAATRQARLLARIREEGGHWKSGRAVRIYGQLGYSGSVRTARFDLAVLRDAGHLAQHDETGVRFYTLNTRKDDRS